MIPSGQPLVRTTPGAYPSLPHHSSFSRTHTSSVMFPHLCLTSQLVIKAWTSHTRQDPCFHSSLSDPKEFWHLFFCFHFHQLGTAPAIHLQLPFQKQSSMQNETLASAREQEGRSVPLPYTSNKYFAQHFCNRRHITRVQNTDQLRGRKCSWTDGDVHFNMASRMQPRNSPWCVIYVFCLLNVYMKGGI